jgi:multidrug resistance efflux pump
VEDELMKIVITIILSTISLLSYEYYSKVEPIQIYKVSSEVSGKVVYSDDFSEGSYSKGEVIIKIFDRLDRVELNTTQVEYNNLKEIVQISREQYEIDKSAYEKIKELSTYSKTQKDTKLLKMLGSKNSLLTYQTNLKKLALQIEILKDRVEKKNIGAKNGLYIYKVYPRVGDFINIGAPLLELHDLSSARLTIYVTADDVENIEKKTIYLNGLKSDYRINKVIRVTDSINISAYRVEIIIDRPKLFSKLIKVEFKEAQPSLNE